MSEGKRDLSTTSFLSRFFLNLDESYSKERYLTLIMRNSIFERILTKYIFQSESKNFDLFPFLDNLKKNEGALNKFKERLKICQELFKEEGPLYFFYEISTEILKLLNEEDLIELKFDKNILKFEFLLAWHFENNFFEKQIDQKMNSNFFDNMFLQKGRTNYNYSIESLNTIFQFLKIFEKQSLTTKIKNENDNEYDIASNHNLFFSEKIYYFYCDKFGREKNVSQVGNIPYYILINLIKKFDILKNSKVNNVQIDNYILVNIFVINKIIKDYSFYLHKLDLEKIFYSVNALKTFPFPVGNHVNQVLENIMNEMYFQGINLLNKLRDEFFIDYLNKNVIEIDTEFFNGVFLVYSNEWDKRHVSTINTEKPDGFNIVKFLDRLRIKKRNNHITKLNIRELTLKLFMTILFNSKESFSNNVLKKIYLQFLPNYHEIYSKENLNLYSKEKKDENGKEIKKIDTGNTKNSLDKLLQVIDYGFDKKCEDFDKQINILASKIISQSEQIQLNSNEDEEEETILNQEAFLPITSFRNYLKPSFINIKKLYRNENENNELEILKLYKENFEYVVKNYFPHFLFTSEDPLIQRNLQKVRENFYHNYRIKIILFEEDGVINDFIENLINKSLNNIEEIISEDNFNSFWKFFVNEKEEITPQFILHVIPHYEKYELNPFRLIEENDNFENNPCYLSEFIASNDNIYKNIVFMPFASNSDPTFFSFIPNCQTLKDNVLVFPSLDCMYSFLKKPLDYYISDSNGILNLDLYKISIGDDKKSEKVFWKNIEIISTETYNVNCKLTLFFVDNLGLEFKDKNRIEIMLNGSFILKIYNLFFKKNVPFNYNMSSNNGWLELFLKENYDKKEINKYCNYSSFIKNSVEGKYYEEFNVPQMDLETIFKNYKVKKIILEGWKNDIQIKYDDNIIYDCSKFISNEKKDITISFFERNHEKVTIPVATFISL